MKIKLDENIPNRLAPILAKLGHQVETVAQEGLTGKSDVDVWAAACNENRFFITQDLDFSDIRRLEKDNHPGLLLLRLREPGANAIFQRITRLFQENPLESWTGCFMVLSEHKLRIKRPEKPAS
ncbi:MAG: DUF5615 family PIN-like protein [Gammaproteobacteria bacterium]